MVRELEVTLMIHSAVSTGTNRGSTNRGDDNVGSKALCPGLAMFEEATGVEKCIEM